MWSKGRHNLQFGIDTQYDRLYVLDASFTVGTWTYNGSRTGYLPADIMMGLPSSFVQDSGRTLDIAEWKHHFWIQDDWKANDRLTVNAGLRWEPWTPPTDALNNLVGFVKGQQSTVAPDAPLGMVYPGDAGIPESLFSNNFGLFAPRIGAAYDLFGTARTVLRGGYGIFYVDPALTIYTRTVSTQPSVLTVSTTNPYSFVDPYNGVPGGNPYPFPRRDPSEFAAFKYVKPVSGGVLEPTDNKGYSQNWNLTLEQQIGKDMSLSVAYVANKGTDILAALELNPAIYGPGATTGNTNSRRTYAGMSAMEIATPYQRSDYSCAPDHRDEAGLAGAHGPVHLRLRQGEGQRFPDGRRRRVLPQEFRESRCRLLVRGFRHPAQVQPVGGVRPSEQHVGDGRDQGAAE